jgi:hypothetical protein
LKPPVGTRAEIVRCETRNGWKDKAMRGISPFGLWTCAALYAAAGVFGLFFLTSQPNAVPATDGYGVIRIAAHNAQ